MLPSAPMQRAERGIDAGSADEISFVTAYAGTPLAEGRIDAQALGPAALVANATGAAGGELTLATDCGDRPS
jgi:hypothetical protein